MYYRKKTKGKKKVVNRKRDYSFSTKTMGVPSGVPKTRRFVMKYHDSVPITNTVGALNGFYIRSNGCFDPRVAGGGHQPFGWDQTVLAFYNHYVVVASRIKCTVVSKITNTGDAFVFGCALTPDTSVSYTTPSEFEEASKVPISICNASTSCDQKCTRTVYYDAKKFFNVTDIKDNLDRLGASTVADPAEGAYFYIWTKPLSTNTESYEVSYTVEYIVDASEPKLIAQS